MHKHRNKRRLRIQLTFIYTIMGLAVLSILTILVLVIQGYRYNRFDGKVEQGGLVQFNSRPTGATVTVDDVTLGNKTASKLTLTAGPHTITIAKDGYSTWKKDVLVKPGAILWLNYARLFPNNPKVTTAANFESVTTSLPSPDHKMMATIAKDTLPEITLATLNDDTPRITKLTIPTVVHTVPSEGQSQSFALEQWDKNNNLLLVRHTYGDKNEYLLVDIRDGKARNITAELGVVVDKISFSLGDSNVLYAITANHELRRLNVVSATVSGPLAVNVDSFTINTERLVTYTTLPDGEGTRTVGYVTQGNNKAKTLKSYALLGSGGLRISTGSYYGEHYVAILHGETLDILRGDLPPSDSTGDVGLIKVASMTIVEGGDYVGFSPGNNRMVYAARGSKIITYDLELKATATISLQTPLTRDVQWLDGYHIISTGETGYFYDFDGTNGQLFASSTINQSAVMSENEKYIYYFATTVNGTALQRVKLAVE